MVFTGYTLDAVDDLNWVDPGQLVEHQLERGGGLDGPFRLSVSVLVDHALDVRARLRRDLQPTVDHLRDRRHGDPGHTSDIGDRHVPLWRMPAVFVRGGHGRSLASQRIFTPSRGDLAGMTRSPRLDLAIEGQQARPVRQEAVIATGAGGPSLIEKLQIAGIDGHSLIGVVANQIAMADVVGPRGTAVGLAGEGIAFGCGLRRP